MNKENMSEEDFKWAKIYEREFQVTAACGMWVAVYEFVAAEVAKPHHTLGHHDGYRALLSQAAYKIWGYFPKEVQDQLSYKPANLPSVQ